MSAVPQQQLFMIDSVDDGSESFQEIRLNVYTGENYIHLSKDYGRDAQSIGMHRDQALQFIRSLVASSIINLSDI